jgi:AcrR family transcriptional regulator
MSSAVNGGSDLPVTGLHSARRADTEQRIIDAATELFLAHGYTATTLTAVARAAGVGDRTVYVRFGTKAALLKRAVDVAIVGDTAPVDVQGREWFIRATTAPTLADRVAAMASGSAALLGRAGPLLAVARQAEATEPTIAAAAQAGRLATLASVRSVWERLHADGLLAPGFDLEWAVATTSLLAHADTYHLMTRTLGWDIDTYEQWFRRTWLHIATPPGQSSAAPSSPPRRRRGRT